MLTRRICLRTQYRWMRMRKARSRKQSKYTLLFQISSNKVKDKNRQCQPKSTNDKKNILHEQHIKFINEMNKKKRNNNLSCAFSYFLCVKKQRANTQYLTTDEEKKKKNRNFPYRLSMTSSLNRNKKSYFGFCYFVFTIYFFSLFVLKHSILFIHFLVQ